MIVPGFALASASSSCGVAAATDGCAVSISGDDASSATPVKSRTASYVRFWYISGAMTKGAGASSSV